VFSSPVFENQSEKVAGMYIIATGDRMLKSKNQFLNLAEISVKTHIKKAE